MNIAKQAIEWVCSLWFVLCGVNSAEMLLWNRKAYRIRPEYDDEGNIIDIKKISIKVTQFIKIPKKHGMMSAFLEGKIVPAILLDAIGSNWRLDIEKKTTMVKLLNLRLMNEHKRMVMEGKRPVGSSPELAYFHPTANRQPESLVYICTPEDAGEYLGMDPYAQVERLNKAFGPASTPAGWECTESNKKELRLVAVDEDEMNMIFTKNKLSVEDGPIILKDYAVKIRPYISDVGKILGANSKPLAWKNLAFQIRVRGMVTVNNSEKKRIIAKCNCNGSTAIFDSTVETMGIDKAIADTCDGVWRCDNIKSKNIKPGDIVTISVKTFEVAKTANTAPENSSSLGVQCVVGNQKWMRTLHQEHAACTMLNIDGTEELIYRAAIFRRAVWDKDLAANLFILVGDKKEVSMADFKSISTAILCNGIVGKDGKLKALYTDSWLNTLIPRWLRFLRDKVWTIQGSKYSQYIAAARILRKGESVMNELDDLKARHHKETGEWIYPVLPPYEAIIEISLAGWLYVNRKKDPQTSSLNLQGCAFCTRDAEGVLQYLDINLQNVGVLARMEFSGMPNGWSTPTSDEFGEDKDGDLLSILLSKLIHFGSHAWYFPRIGEGVKEKVVFARPTTNIEWDAYVDYLNSQYDGYAIAAKNTGMLDLETRIQCCTAIVKGNLENGVPFNNRVQRMFNYIREELGIKVSKHGIGGKTGTAMAEDPQELLRSLTYGEISPKEWPQLFRATHKYGGAPLSWRWNNRFVLNCILTAILRAEKERKDGSKIDFFLDYAFDIIRKAKVYNAKLQLPLPDGEGTDALSKQYAALWNLKKAELSKGCIFTPQEVIDFIGEKKGQGIRGLYADLSSSYQSDPNKSERYRALGLAYTYLLSYYPYYRGIWDSSKILRKFAVKTYLRFRPIEELLYKDEADLTPEETVTLQDKGWLDSGVWKETPILDTNGVDTGEVTKEFIVFEPGFKGATISALKEISIATVATWYPRFFSIDDARERIKQVDQFLMLCLIYTGSVAFGSGYNYSTGKGYTKTATIMNYFPPELYVEVARMRYDMLKVKCALLDQLPELWARHDEYVSLSGFTEEDTDIND